MIDKIATMENTVEVDVDAENFKIVESYIVTNFFNFACKVSQEFLSLIRVKYGSNLMQLTYLGSMMHYDAASRTLMDLDIYVLRNYNIDLPFNFNESSIPSTYDEIIKWQFNRLPSKPFQKLTKCASIIGRQFSIDDLCAVWPNVHPPQRRIENTTPLKQYLLGTLLLNDYFEFFERCSDKEEDTFQSSNAKFQFRFAEVRNIIRLKIIGDTERLVRQKNLILHYEKQLTTITEPFYIPLISYHYSITYFTDLNTLQKRIKYLLMLGSYLSRCTESYMEAQFIFTQVDRILEKYGLHQRMGPYLSSEWDINMAITFANCPDEFMNPYKSIDYLNSGLSKLGYEWPDSIEQWKRIILSNSAIISFDSCKRLLLEKLKRNRISPASNHDSLVSNLEYLQDIEVGDRNLRWRRISLFLTLMTQYLSKTNGSMYQQLALQLSLLDIDIRHHHSNTLSQNIVAYISIALMFLYIGHTNSSIFIFKSISKKLQNDETVLHNSPESFSLSMVYLTATGNWEIVDNQAAECMKLCRNQGK